MKNLIIEFNASMERVKNNFYLSFLSINYLNLRPFERDVQLDVCFSNNVIKTDSLNSVDLDCVNEYVNSIRRHFINDMVITYERYSTQMIASHENDKLRIDSAVLNDRTLSAHRLEQLEGVFLDNQIQFLQQLRRLRNSIVHYNGVYCVLNKLDYTFGKNIYSSRGNEGQSISIEFDSLLFIYNELIEIVKEGNTNYFKNYF